MNNIPGQPTGPYARRPIPMERRPVPPMFDMQRVRNLVILVVGIGILAFAMLVWPFADNSDDVIVPPTDVVTTEVPAMVGMTPEEIAHELYTNDPAGTCFEVAISNRPAIEAMIVGASEGYITAEQAIRVYDSLLTACQEGNWGL